VFGKFNTESMKRAFMQACDETFNHLPGQKFQGGKLLQPALIHLRNHGYFATSLFRYTRF
jgi:hypothetical protein